MKIKNLLLLFFFLFLYSFASGQNDSNQIVRTKGKYNFQNKTYNRIQLEEIIITDQLAYNYYEKFKSTRSVANLFAVISGGIMLVGIGVAVTNESDIDAFSGLFIIGTSFIPLTLSTLISASGDKRFRKSIKYFNGNIKNKESLGANPAQLNLQYSNNGIGLVLNF